jgi:hypothetical protein
VNNTCKLPVSDTKKAIEPFIQKKWKNYFYF